MRVLFVEYPSNVWNLGGKERRARDMARELSSLGVEVVYHSPWEAPDTAVDIVQLFGSEYYQGEIVARAKSLGLRVAMFSILVFPDERAMRLARLWEQIDPLLPISTTHRIRKRMLQQVDLLMFSGEDERRNAERIYGVRPHMEAIVPSTVSLDFLEATPARFIQDTGLRDFVLSVGRIEPRKNIHRIIDAAVLAGLPLVIIGGFDRAHPEYCAGVRARIERHRDVHWFPPVAPGAPWLLSAYAAARVSVLASFHETCGMVNLEATLAGANVVSSDLPSPREYMQHWAWYVDPHSVDSIARGLRDAFEAPFDPDARDHVATRFSTRASAEKMLRAYERLLAVS